MCIRDRLSRALCAPQERHELSGARAHGRHVEYRVFLSHRRPTQGHPRTPSLCQDRCAPAAAARAEARASQARAERISAARIRRPLGEGGARAHPEGRKAKRRTATSAAKGFGWADHPGSAAALESEEEVREATCLWLWVDESRPGLPYRLATTALIDFACFSNMYFRLVIVRRTSISGALRRGRE